MNNEIEINREFCLSILKEYTQSDSLFKHAYAVEACVRFYAEKLGENVEFAGCIALLHDFDYEKYPSEKQHPYEGNKILEAKGFSEEFRTAIMSHADYTGIARETMISKILFACDELAGFITAVAYVRPSKSIDEVAVKSVKKKMKDKGFARAVNREDIIKGAEELGIQLEEHIQNCIDAMKKAKDVLGL